MGDAECVAFLQWALPRLRLRWAGFRKVRRQVCRRIERRRRELELPDLEAYGRYLEGDRDEWLVLDRLCRVTISRFYRDRGVFAFLEHEVLPELASGGRGLELWSAGCASGEEPYTLALIWELALRPRFPAVGMRILATDADPALLARAAAARYLASSLKDLPGAFGHGFFREDSEYRLRPEVTHHVRLVEHDVRDAPPPGRFDAVLCRNLAFTYFDEKLQREIAARLVHVLRPGGALVIGSHESLQDQAGLASWSEVHGVYRRVQS